METRTFDASFLVDLALLLFVRAVSAFFRWFLAFLAFRAGTTKAGTMLDAMRTLGGGSGMKIYGNNLLQKLARNKVSRFDHFANKVIHRIPCCRHGRMRHGRLLIACRGVIRRIGETQTRFGEFLGQG